MQSLNRRWIFMRCVKWGHGGAVLFRETNGMYFRIETGILVGSPNTPEMP